MSRSIAVRERTGVSESGGVERPAEDGSVGAVQPCSRHQLSHLATAARREFQVLTAAMPHRDSRAAPISASVTEPNAQLGPRSPSEPRLSSWSTVLTTAMVHARRVLPGPRVSRNASADPRRERVGAVWIRVTVAAIGPPLLACPG
ncbi:hypothetical protein [Nocardia sp. CA-120079]|uniref:hypothetical protein n=1 Tax=Nocardia sp. CA-120079 TaxID=3239974 RepID=UPI003D985DA3